MKIASRVAGIARSLFGRRTRLGVGLAVAVTVLVPLLLWGQSGGWQGSSPVYVNPGVSVGVGTTSPNTNLEVVGYMRLNDNGAASSLQLFSGATQRGDLAIAEAPGQFASNALAGDVVLRTAGGKLLLDTSNGSRTPALTILGGGGNVGIGTASPQYPLSVNGIVQAKEVLVNTGWSDYVFDPSYRLKPLSEVASYIKTNGHLPDIPAAKEVEAKGVSLGEMQSKLLAKVEELTLHMIEADQENRELQERIARLEAEQRTAGGDAGSR